jgi:outer membrane protein OmpA-like peptidoglycan-associated protein
LTLPLWSQKWAEKGHQQFQDLAYSDAIISLEKAVKNGEGNERVFQELGDAYYYNANYQASAKWYQLLFKESKTISSDCYFRFAQTLKASGKEEEAAIILRQMEGILSRQASIFAVLKQSKGIATQLKNPDRFKVQKVAFNSNLSDFGPAYFGNQIVFASARDTGSVYKRNHSWTNQSFTDLYAINPDSVLQKPSRLSKSVNSKFNESSAVFTKDGNTMYFTRNNFQNKKKGVDENQITLLKIYKAVKKGNKWMLLGALPFCEDFFNTAHPALSPDEKIVYFASDRPGSLGRSDLYKVQINPDGTFGKPENLGPTINTIGRETFPFISQSGLLYFASDGREGRGGLDIYVSNQDRNALYLAPQNLGQPINSRADDFGFIMNEVAKTGFFTSNRSGGIGFDDIYSFTELFPLPCETILHGTVALQNANNLLAGVQIVLLDANLNQLQATQADENGNYKFTVYCGTNYFLQTNLTGYVAQQITVEPTKYTTATVAEIRLVKEQIQFQIGDNLAEKWDLSPIYFDLSQATIRTDAALVLAKVKKVLIEYPTLTLEIRSHTDSRDTFTNNQRLSNQRAESTVNWLVENGIEADRLTGFGFGESLLLNACADKIPCSEEEHQANRRSMFVVTGI